MSKPISTRHVVMAGCFAVLGGVGCDSDLGRVPSKDDVTRVAAPLKVDVRLEGAHAAEAVIGDDIVTDAVVTIDRIYLQPDVGERVVLRSEPVTMSMLELGAHADDLGTAFKATADVANKDYEQLRFVISGAYIDVQGKGIYASDGYAHVPTDRDVVGELTLPSFDSSGLKVQLREGFFAGSDGEIAARFDVVESLGHAAGGKWVMSPVIDVVPMRDTATLILMVDATSIASAIDGALHATLFDAQGNVEASLDLDQSATRVADVLRIPRLFPGEGPFSVKIYARTLPAAADVVTEPAEIEFALPKGGDALRVDVTAKALRF